MIEIARLTAALRQRRGLQHGLGFVVWLSGLLAVCTIAMVAHSGSRVDQAELSAAAYLTVLTMVLARIRVELPRGRMNLTAIATQSAAMLLPPQLAVVVGLSSALYRTRQRPPALPLIARTAGYAFWTTAGSAVHEAALAGLAPAWVADLLVVVSNSAINWIVIGLFIGALNGEPLPKVLRRNSSPAWFFAFAAFGAASTLLAELLRIGGLAGYAYATLIPILAIALRSHVTLDSIQPTLRASVKQVTEQSEYVRELEATLHDLRNVLMTASVIASNGSIGDLRPVLTEALDVSRGAFAGRTASRIKFEELELRELLTRASVIAKPVAAAKGVALLVELPAEPTPVIGDSVLLVEALTNLMLNATDVTPAYQTVRISLEVPKSGQRVVKVTDSGAGFAAGESLETTAFGASSKGPGHGIGLRWSHAIALQHLGRLTLDSTGRQGSTISLRLPSPREAQRRLSALHRLDPLVEGK